MLDIIAQPAQVAVGLCFSYAAVSKSIAFRGFEAGIARFEVVSPALVRPAALTVISLELLVAFSFLAYQMRLCGAAVAGSLLVIFLAVIVSARHRGIVAPCMCFGPNDAETSTPKTISRIAFLGVGVTIVIFDILLTSGASSPLSWPTAISAVCVVLACATLAEMPDVLAVVFGSRAFGLPTARGARGI